MKTYTREELENMPTSKLRHIDIYSKDQEILLQSIFDARMIAMPQVGPPLVFHSSMTDNMTGEKEQALQKQMDDYNEKNRKSLLEKYQVVEPEPEPEVEPKQIQEDDKVKTPFCQFCNSKGGRHKKVCTRLVTV